MSCRYYLFPRQIIYLFFLLWTYCNVIDSCCREIIRLRGKYRTTSETINKSTIIAINGSLKFEITAKRLYAASQRVL